MPLGFFLFLDSTASQPRWRFERISLSLLGFDNLRPMGSSYKLYKQEGTKTAFCALSLLFPSFPFLSHFSLSFLSFLRFSGTLPYCIRDFILASLRNLQRRLIRG